jgi:hypothetical protein
MSSAEDSRVVPARPVSINGVIESKALIEILAHFCSPLKWVSLWILTFL